MKLLLCLLLTLSSVALAGPESQKLGEQLADVTGAEKALHENFLATIDNAMAQMKGGDPVLFKAIKDATQQFYTEHYKWAELRPIFGQIYAADFTDDELKAVIAFYESPVGKKVAEKFSGSSRIASQQVAEKMKSKTPQLQSTLMQLVQKHVEAKGAAKR
jgi:hypothetical protein